ncbi:prepilin peptidase [Patescibacteria group bacterium]|nr:prepilin peptidase [Patescibacteria group bacterium]MBU1029458.1 prepilin peptidase [Patescibacteria group bacterium]MBU1916052.1 prepilin peptidase [Patescibacteria group bacterium]
MPLLLPAFIFVFGIIIGSFLNAVIWRLRTKESFLISRSYCPHCRHGLSWRDLIPLLSWLLLRGKCRYCSVRISLSYFLVELIAGILFLLVALRILPVDFQNVGADSLASLLLAWSAVAILIIVFVYDLQYMLILRSVTLPAAVLFFIANVALGKAPIKLIIAIIICAGFFWLQHVLSRGKWIGGGDVYLGVLMGALLGFPKILLALFMAYIIGATTGVSLLVMQQKSWKSELPFGTFLSLATIVTLLYGDLIIHWYLGLI